MKPNEFLREKGLNYQFKIKGSNFNGNLLDLLNQYTKQCKITNPDNSYAIVRWHDNRYEDVVCANREIAEEYVKNYNRLSGREECYLDEDIWLPLTKS